MRKALAAAAATAAAASSALLGFLPPPQALAPAVLIVALPHQAEAARAIEPPETVQGDVQALEEPEPDKQVVKAMIKAYARKYGVNAGIMDFTVSCETAGTYDPTIQSSATYSKDRPEWDVKKGDRELSFGLAQIHLPANPDVSLEQATDPDFALDFLARGLSRGEFWRWSCLVK